MRTRRTATTGHSGGARWVHFASITLATAIAFTCTDSQGPPPAPDATTDTFVASLAMGQASSELVAYISLRPGTMAAEGTVTLRLTRTGAVVTRALIDGGFDPVPLSARIGDTIVVTVLEAGASVPRRHVVVVPEPTPPVIVRTSPPPDKRDVVLNARMTVVFSEPMDAATLNASTLRLMRDSAAVTGRVEFTDSTRVSAEFIPDQPLAPSTDYELVVTRGLRDDYGTALESSLSVRFTTGAAATASALRLVPLTSTTITGLAGSAVTPTPAVRVINEANAPMPGMVVTFAIVSGGGTLVGASAVSDSGGLALLGGWTLGTTVGGSVLRGRLGSTPTVTVDFTATVHAGAASTIVRVSGDGQRGQVGETLAGPLSVRVSDSFDNPVAGVAVAFSVLTGGGAVSGSATTNGNGVASAGRWTLGPTVGEQRVAATVGSTRVEFTAIASDPCPLPCAPGVALAFVRDGDIHLANEDGSEVVRLTSGGISGEPAWSPDGRQIAFTRANASTGFSDIMLMDADGSNVRPWVSNASSPSWSPDGRQIAYAGLFDGTLWLLVRGVADSSGPTRIGFDRGNFGSPAWSPDGRRIAFIADWVAFDFAMEVYVVDPDGSDVQQVTNGFFGNVSSWPTYLTYYAPAWSPDGTRFAVTTCVEWQWASCTESSVAVMGIDGSGLRTLATTIASAGPVWVSGWLSNQMIAFTRTCTNNACPPSVFVVPADGGAERLLIANASDVARRP